MSPHGSPRRGLGTRVGETPTMRVWHSAVHMPAAERASITLVTDDRSAGPALPCPERPIAILPEQERRELPVERPNAGDRQLAADAERDVAAAAERQVERRPEQCRRVHRGVERLGLLEL